MKHLKIILLLGLLTLQITANELKNEASPYLQQHANNPVHWLPWSKKALAKAKKEHKLIFLSIGYSTCHWCHVMEHESFENEKIAKLLNTNYVSIKVDREEYPNIDKHYQEIYRLMNHRSGGWPLTVIMTPQAQVFFTATYLPPETRYNYQGLSEILPELNKLYLTQKDEVINSANSIKEASNRIALSQIKSSEALDKNLSKNFVTEIKQQYDFTYKGIGDRPKFPHATTIDTLLDIYDLTANKEAKSMAVDMLKAMAKGGINDQIEGGFYRYSTDERWRIPHFEKMLYTNAELIESYAHAYKITKDGYFKNIIKSTISNMETHFEKDQLFYSASDADSDGVKGKYFTFTQESCEKALKKKGFSKIEIDEVLAYFGIVFEGNFEEGQNNPYVANTKVPKKIEQIKNILRTIRASRHYPFIDYKVQASWNALYIHGLFKAHHTKKALQSLEKLLSRLYINGALYHQIIRGKQPKVKGYLEDYAFVIATLLDAHQATLDKKYLTLAQALSQKSLKKFYKNGQWFISDDGFNSRSELYDASYRSPMMVMIEDLLKLAMLHDDFDGYALAKSMMRTHAKQLNQSPSSYAYASKIALMIQNPIVVIKSSKANLLKHKKQIDAIIYPFVLRKEIQETEFQACTMQQCFASHPNIKQVILDIEKLHK